MSAITGTLSAIRRNDCPRWTGICTSARPGGSSRKNLPRLPVFPKGGWRPVLAHLGPHGCRPAGLLTGVLPPSCGIVRDLRQVVKRLQSARDKNRLMYKRERKTAALRFRANPIRPRPHRRRPRPRRGKRREGGAQAEAHPTPEVRGDPPPRPGRGFACGDWPQLQRVGMDDFKVDDLTVATIGC
jgi:hypothetical protein